MSARLRLEELWTSMTDNELIDLCVTCGCGLTFSSRWHFYFKPGDDVDKTLPGLRESISASVLLPANFHWCGFRFTSRILFSLNRVTGNSSWRISGAFPNIIIQEFFDHGLPDIGLMTNSLKSVDDQLKFEEQVNEMRMEKLKGVVFSVIKECSAKTKELRRTEILESLKEWTA